MSAAINLLMLPIDENEVNSAEDKHGTEVFRRIAAGRGNEIPPVSLNISLSISGDRIKNVILIAFTYFEREILGCAEEKEDSRQMFAAERRRK